MIKSVLSHFGYEELRISSAYMREPGYLETTEVPRFMTKGMEDILFVMTGRNRDNKCAFVFEDTMGDTYAVSFYDSKTIMVCWSSRGWDSPPKNLSLRQGWNGTRHHPTNEELGIIK